MDDKGKKRLILTRKKSIAQKRISTPLKDLFPALFILDRRRRCKIKDRVSSIGAAGSTVWEWTRMPSTDLELQELGQINVRLQGVTLSDRRDQWMWIGASSNMFSVGAVKRSLISAEASGSLFVMKWCRWLPIKCNIFAWRAEMGKIPMAVALRSRNIQVEVVDCPLCQAGEESAEHLFTSCVFAVTLWQHIGSWCGTPIFAFSIRDLLEMHSFSGLQGLAQEVFHGLIIIGCWSLWRARNALKFDNKTVRMEEIIGEVKSVGFLCVKNRTKLKSLSWSNWCNFILM